jgi:hypothetical protein
MAQQLEAAELLLLDQGATAAGSSRPRSDATAICAQCFSASRNEQISAVAVWLSGDSDDTLH